VQYVPADACVGGQAAARTAAAAADDMPRKSAKKKQALSENTTVTVHKKQQLADLLEAAATCKLIAIQRYLAAEGSADVLFDSRSPDFTSKVPLLVGATVGHHISSEHKGSMKALIDAGATLDLTFKTTAGDRTALMIACSLTCCDAPVQLLLQHGADPCMRCFDAAGNFFTVLQNAALHGSVSKCQLLLDAGAARTLDQKNLQGWTAIHCAASEGNVEVVRLLHECSAKTNIIDKSGCSLLHLAARFPAVLQYVLQNSSIDVNAVNEHSCTALTVAAAAGASASVRLLLQRGADPSIRDCHSRCAATFAAETGFTDVMEVLLAHNTPATLATVYHGLPLLTLAVASGQLAVARLLLQRGADVHALNAINELNQQANPALYFCAFNKQGAAMTALLLQHGADANGAGSDGDTPLLGAAIRGDVSSGRVLIDTGADAAVVTPPGFTCLHAAAHNEHPEMLQLLLECGGAAVIDNLFPLCGCCGNRSALMMCKQPTEVKLMLAAGADVHLRTATKGNTVLHVAAVHGYPASVLCLLIKAGIDLRAVNSAGKTAAQVAAESGNTLAAALLTRAAVGP
jgi:uncharacterized protein